MDAHISNRRSWVEIDTYEILCDHSNVFRDEDDRTVGTFSPYHDISPDIVQEIYLPGYDVEISDLSIYG